MSSNAKISDPLNKKADQLMVQKKEIQIYAVC